MDPWHRMLIKGIACVIVGVAIFWAGLSLKSRLKDDKNEWIGVVMAILGAAVFLYSLRYFGLFFHLFSHSW